MTKSHLALAPPGVPLLHAHVHAPLPQVVGAMREGPQEPPPGLESALKRSTELRAEMSSLLASSRLAAPAGS